MMMTGGDIYTFELQRRYGLVHNYTESREDQQNGIEKAVEILADAAAEYQTKREQLLSDSIDVTAFMVWFVQNYPQSKKMMKQNPDHLYQFR